MIPVIHTSKTRRATFAEAVAKGAGNSASLDPANTERKTYSLKRLLKTRHRPVKIFF